MFRLQGLVTLLTVSSLRARAGFISRRQRSWDSPFGAFSSGKVSGPFPPGWTHVPFLLPLYLPHEAAGRPGRPRLLGFDPSESPLQPCPRLADRLLDAPLGFSPSRALCRQPCPRSLSFSSHALSSVGRKRPKLPAPQSVNRLPAGHTRAQKRTFESGRSGPCRVLAPPRF